MSPRPTARLRRLLPVRGLLSALTLGLAVAASSGTAHAQLGDPPETERSMMLELRGGFYTPEIDDQFETARPYEDTFGSDPMIHFELHGDLQLWQGFGSLAIGGSVGYSWVDGEAKTEDGSASDDTTTLNIVPVTLSVVYRLDELQRRWGVPLVPYVKLGLVMNLWWVTNGAGDVATAWGADQIQDAADQTLDEYNAETAREALGATFGYHVAAGLQFHLDWMAPGMASGFDQEVGVNNSYLFVEYAFRDVNDFYSDKSWNLRSQVFSAGLMFEF